MNKINIDYLELLAAIIEKGESVSTRNYQTIRMIDLCDLRFNTTPLITCRQTAWEKALYEMQWFISGDDCCPEPLATSWWKGQLNRLGCYLNGYPKQLRRFGYHGFDQIEFILDSIKHHPASRRAVMTTWNPEQMSRITLTNNNPNTPATCHGTMTQWFVSDGELHCTHYQRSADMLLGLPHNLIQYWALMLFFAHHADLGAGTIRWVFGDAHIYDEPSHMIAVHEMLQKGLIDDPEYQDSEDAPILIYQPGAQKQGGVPAFLAEDFKMIGAIPAPLTTVKPRLLT